MLFWIMMAASFALDQVTKHLVTRSLPLGGSAPFLGDFMQLHLIHNEGASFSMLSGQRWLFLILTVVVVAVVIVVHFRYVRGYPWFDALLGVFIGATLGNFCDRLLHGYVVDFFDVGWFPVFNVADCCIDVSVVILCIMLLFGKPKTAIGSRSQQNGKAGRGK